MRSTAEMREHAFDEWLGEELYVRLGRAQRPEVRNRFRALAAVEVAPEMILQRSAARGMTSAHGYLRRPAMRLAIS